MLPVDRARFAGDRDLMFCKNLAQHADEEISRVVNRDESGKAAVIERKAAGNVDDVLRDRSIDADAAQRSFRTGLRSVDDCQIRQRGSGRYPAWQARSLRRFYEEIDRVVVHRDRKSVV